MASGTWLMRARHASDNNPWAGLQHVPRSQNRNRMTVSSSRPAPPGRPVDGDLGFGGAPTEADSPAEAASRLPLAGHDTV